MQQALGRRVSVRSSAGEPGPTGGPGFRDVVGVLATVGRLDDLRWSIRTRSGEVVLVDPSTVVAAKIVPDAPAKLRAAFDVTVADLEHIAAQAWQPLEQQPLGGWVLRAAAGFTGRANSVLPLGDPGMPIDDAIAVLTAWYAERELPAMVQVPLPLREDLDTSLAVRGWDSYSPVCVMTCDLGPLRMATQDATDAPGESVDTAPAPDAEWLASFRYGEATVPPAAVPLMTKAEHPVFASIRGPAGVTRAIARGAIVDRWLGITAVEVAEPFRRQGRGRQIIGALADYAAHHRCRYVFLQVAHDNVGARALYDQLGFVAHHDYVYRRLTTGRR